MRIKSRTHARGVVGFTVALSFALVATAGGSATATQSPPRRTTRASNQIAAAQKALGPFAKLPTSIPQTTPLKAAPEKGKVLVWTECDAPQCAIATKYFKEATEAVGWKLQVVNYKTADPATLVAAMQHALQYKPVATILVAQPFAVWNSVVPDYEKAGVAIIPWATGDVGKSTAIPTIVLDNTDYDAAGIAVANWFIVDSKAAGNALVWNVSQIPPIDRVAQTMRKTIEAGCSGCKVTMLDAPYADVASGKAVPAIVSALQRDRSIKYVLSAESALTTPLSGQLKAVGIKGIKIAGYSVEAADETLIKSGDEGAGVPNASNIVNYLTVDAALRIAEGAPLPIVHTNYTLLTKSLDFKPNDEFSYPADWREQFKKLWKVG